MAEAFARISLWLLVGWLALLAAAVLYRGWAAGISITDLLRSSSSLDASFDPERIQNLALFLFVLGGFVLTALRGFPTKSLPEIPETLLVLLAGSNGAYLTGKVIRK
jgi:hypothetical protein